MSTFGLFAFLVLPILGGLIAWAGDVIGYRLGKSRRSLFGLRPRRTARVVGVAVGVALPLFGLLTALAGSSDARDALLHIDSLRREQDHLQRDNEALQARNFSLQTQIASAQKQADESERHAVALRADLRNTGHQLQSAEGHLRSASSRLALAQHDIADLRTARSSLLRLRSHLQGQVTTLTARSGRLQRDVERVNGTLADVRSTLTGVDNELALVSAELRARQADLERQLAAANSPTIFESGHELIRAIIEFGSSIEDTEEKLSKLLMAASVAAQANGAEVGPNTLAVRLDGPRPPGLKPTDKPSEREILASFAAERQRAGPRKWVIMVRVLRRMYDAENAQASVELYSLPYVLAFHKDEVIYSARIDGSQPRASVFNELWNLVTKLVRREAQEHGLLRDPETNQYGSFPTGELLEALDTIASHHQPVLVQVRAARDTYITDPLAIRIEIEPEQQAGLNGHHSRH
jgi:predicted  nucleic acid-binding Zn-ribbon protein